MYSQRYFTRTHVRVVATYTRTYVHIQATRAFYMTQIDMYLRTYLQHAYAGKQGRQYNKHIILAAAAAAARTPLAHIKVMKFFPAAAANERRLTDCHIRTLYDFPLGKIWLDMQKYLACCIKWGNIVAINILVCLSVQAWLERRGKRADRDIRMQHSCCLHAGRSADLAGHLNTMAAWLATCQGLPMRDCVCVGGYHHQRRRRHKYPEWMGSKDDNEKEKGRRKIFDPSHDPISRYVYPLFNVHKWLMIRDRERRKKYKVKSCLVIRIMAFLWAHGNGDGEDDTGSLHWRWMTTASSQRRSFSRLVSSLEMARTIEKSIEQPALRHFQEVNFIYLSVSIFSFLSFLPLNLAQRYLWELIKCCFMAARSCKWERSTGWFAALHCVVPT